MKTCVFVQQLVLIFAFYLLAGHLFAITVTIVTNSNNTFTPNSVAIAEGDTVCFQNISATHPLVFASNTSTSYTSNTCFVLAVGNHDFYCQIHQVIGMEGSITVNPSTGMPPIDSRKAISVAYPNPFKNRTTLSFPNTTDKINIYNIMGIRIKSYEIKGNEVKLEIDLSNVPSGIYFYSPLSNGRILETKKIVKTR